MRQATKITVVFTSAFLLLGLAGCYYPSPNCYAPADQPQVNNPQECREYEQTGTVQGKAAQLVSTACRQPDGTWRDTVDGAQIDGPPPPIAAAPAPLPPRSAGDIGSKDNADSQAADDSADAKDTAPASGKATAAPVAPVTVATAPAPDAAKP
jgi:hypothetical protein